MFIKKSKEMHQSPPNSIIKALGLPVSHTTIIIAIHGLGYRRCMARRRQLLKKINYKCRLEFARAHKDWTIEDWKRVIFTDEMSMKIEDQRKDIVSVWRKPGEKFHKDCVNPKK